MLTILISLLLPFLISALIPKRRKVKADRVGGDPGLFGFMTLPAKLRFLLHGRSLVYNRYNSSLKDHNYYLQTTLVDRLVLAPKYLAELRDADPALLNTSVASVENTLGEFSGIDVILKDRQTHDLCRGKLTRSLLLMIPVLARKLQALLNHKLEHCTADGPVSYTAYELIESLNNLTSSLTLVGPELTKKTEWSEPFLDVLPAIQAVILSLAPLPHLLRNIISPILPATRRLRNLHTKLRAVLFPKNKEPLWQSSESPTFLQFFVESSKTKTVDKEEIVAKVCVLITNMVILHLLLELTHLLTTSTTNALYSLCSNPSYVPALRAELISALESTNGVFTFETLKALRKMDSFIKESQRWTPPSFLTFNRTVMRDIPLSDGTILPAGQFISMPGGPMTRDPLFYNSPDPNEFDGYRFYNKTSAPHQNRNQNQNQANTSSSETENELSGIEPGNLQWGVGKLTCPGRWYASAVMKLMVALVLREFEVRFPEGQTDREGETTLDTFIHPSETQRLVFRRLG
ncbi:cytochrome P450 [Lophiostoma macrostomum CBS 122681]|uniref:Cytochrome P450 n=1 Tax=Lophiostoma macrostomum CBS 122681 TaxID=1314788 RepID=A0A6A6TQ44_9PLEO|nr:cytochrome P450 [Lophiostoma macrostomum CBS 122681]